MYVEQERAPHTKSRRWCVCLLLLAAACAPVQTTTSRGHSREVANLHAFARLYGVVRWFHPSDAAAAIDWDRFADDGVRSVVTAPDADALLARLGSLFGPIAPTVQIIGPRAAFMAAGPRAVTATETVAWQHRGYGDSVIATGYASKRTHRSRRVPEAGDSAAALFQAVSAEPYRGSRIRLRGKIRTADHGLGQLWMRVERPSGVGFLETMGRRPVTSSEWTSAEIVGRVDPDATRIVFGELAVRGGTAWYDDLELAVESSDDRWTPIEIQNGDFEEPDPRRAWHAGIARGDLGVNLAGWEVSADHDRPAAGRAALRVQQVTKLVDDELFALTPGPTETIDIELGSGLRARVPLSLPSRGGRTAGDDPERARALQAHPRDAGPGFDALAGLADIVVVWNVYQHFWPYWDVVSVDWERQLDTSLARGLAERSTDDHRVTLDLLTAGAPDGHASTTCPGESEVGYLPFVVDRIGDDVAVTSSSDPAIERGDLVTAIDGEPIEQRLAHERSRISGSPWWREANALRQLGRGRPGSAASVGLRRRGTVRTAIVARVSRAASDPPAHGPLERLDDGTYYVDLSRASMADLDAALGDLVNAPGIVFDLRLRPNHNHQFLSHLMTREAETTSWAAIPMVIHPDRRPQPDAWSEEPASEMPNLHPVSPRLKGRIAFLSGPLAISYTESVLELVAHYRLGAIVGTRSAGTNGDIAQIGEPTGCWTTFTGRRVTHIDGSRHHLVGVQPTIPAGRTLAGITEGRDEVLERALAFVRTGR